MAEALKGRVRSSEWLGLGLAVSCFLLVSAPLFAATGDVLGTFAAPGTGPYGLAWDGTNLWLADRDTDLVYEVTTAGAVLSSFPTPGADPTGLTWDGTHLWLVDEVTDLIYELDPVDGSVLSSISTPGPEPTGLTWDGTNLWLADINTDLIYELNTTGTVISSFAAPWNLPRGLAWDGTNLWNANGNIYELTTTGTELSFFFSPFVNGQTGLTFDGTDFWLAQDWSGPGNSIYQLEGPPTCTVTTTADSTTGGSLRACIIWANGNPGADTITIPAGTYNLNIAGTGEDAAATGDLDITDSLTLNGAGVGSTIIDGNVIDRVFDVRLAGTTVAMSNLTIRDGNAAGNDGGGIRSDRNLTLNDVTMSNNTARLGGAIFSTTESASLTLNNVLLDSNTATGHGGSLTMNGGASFTLTDVTMNGSSATNTGGAVRLDNATGTMTGVIVTGNNAFEGGGFSLNDPGTNLTLTDVTMSSNTATRNGGGVISRDATVTATGVTVNGNSCTTNPSDGGGFRFQGGGTVNLSNVTISGNTSNQGGGLSATGTVNMTLTNVTFSGNGATTAGGGLFNGATLTLANTIVANSTTGGDCSGTLFDGGNNLDTDGSCGVGLTAPPLLGALQNNGGPTLTHALLAGSPAIDTSDAGCLPTDQRGVSRPIDGDGDATATCDIGAYESPTPAGSWVISGTVYNDINANSALDPGELGSGSGWVKLILGGSVIQAIEPDPDSGAYSLAPVIDGIYTVIVDDNNAVADSTASAPVNWLFQNPASGSLVVNVTGTDVTDQDIGLVFDFDLAADCACGYGDGLFTQTAITIDGDIADWALIFPDGDNNACDAVDDTDLDHPVQSTGRNLLRTAVTYDASYFSMWTQRVGSSNNTQNFMYYADTSNDGILQAGEPVIVAKWQGNTGTVTLEKYAYDDLGSGGDPLLDSNGFADGYSMPGDLTFVKTLTMPDGSGRGSTTGSTDGTQMEWTVAWAELGVAPGAAIAWHIGSTNANPGSAGLGAQIDDNLGGCGEQCTGSNQFAGVVVTPISGGTGQTVYSSHAFTNTGNGDDLFDLAWTSSGDFVPASVTYYQDLGTVGQYDSGVDLLLTDTDGDTDPDTGVMSSGASFDLLIAVELPGPGTVGSATVTTTATSNFVPGCGGTVIPVSGSVDIPLQIVPSLVKRAFEADGTPIANGTTVPQGATVKFLIYVDNPGPALSDVSVQDVLDTAFLYQANSIKVDNTLQSSVVCPGGVCDEAAIFASVNGQPASTDVVDGDTVSYTGTTIDAGDAQQANATLNIAADSVWALLFTVTMQ